ncbi:MAG: mechanosensitive ion channel family protein, partial [Eubacterium sp.]
MEFITELYKENSFIINIVSGFLIFLVFFALRNKFSSLILSLFGKILYSKNPERKKRFEENLKKPLSVFFLILGLYIGISVNYQHEKITDAFKIAMIIIVCWSVLCYISDNLYAAFSSKGNPVSNGVAVKFISNLLKVIVVCIAVVMVLAELGYNINGLITGLGVGGLAVSLSAQDTLKNLISGFVILFDKPFDVGDLIETSDFKGIVEDITMRSTRIRKLDDSVLIVPNSAIADASVSNYARLTKKLVEFNIGIVYASSNNIIKKCEEDIKNYLTGCELTDKDT